MPNCTEGNSSKRLEFGHLGQRAIEGRFDGGVILLAKLDQRLGLIDAAARAIADPHDPSSVKHSIRDMLRQREYGLAQGWEELNNHPQLRQDIAFQTAVGRDDELASAPTLCRLEKLGSRAAAVKLHEVLVDQFIASFKTAPQSSTSTPPTARSMANRKAGSFMATTTVTATCRCMCFAANRCWPLICVPPRSMAPSMRRRC